MKKFISLVKREHMQYDMTNYLVAALAVLAIGVGPMLLQKLGMGGSTGEIRYILVFLSLFIVGLFAVCMALASLNKDIKLKELWLHSTASIYKLVGVKVVYHGVVMLLINALVFSGYFFVDDVMTGTMKEYVMLALMYFSVMVGIYLAIISIVLPAVAFMFFVQKWVGKLSYALTFVGVLSIMRLLVFVPEPTFLEIGHVPLEQLNAHLPLLKQEIFGTPEFMNIYIVEELYYVALYAVIYMLACKWLERVITR